MTTAYSPLLGLALPVTGELSGTWGDTVNNSITSLLDSAVAGTTTLSTDADVTLTTTTGAANTAREAILLFSGARTALRTITAPAQSKIYTVINATTGGFSVKIVGAGPTTGVTIVAGESAVVAWNGSDFIKISNTGGSASFTNVTVSGTATLSGLTASTALALDASKNVVSVTNTGSGNNVLSTSPTLVTPILGTPTSVTLTNATGLPLSTGVTGTLPTINGGTGLTSFTANGVVYASSTSALTTGSALTFNGYDSFSFGGSSAAAYNTFLVQNTAANGYSRILFNAGTSVSSVKYAPGIFFGIGTETDSANTPIVFFVGNGSEQMRLTSTGLGIGTSSPSFSLDVGGPTANIRIAPSSTTNNALTRYVNAGGIGYVGLDNSVGGLSTAYALNLYHTGAYPIVFSTNNAEKMRLDSSGNLGLGVTPSASTLPTIESQYGLFVGQGQTNIVANAYYSSGYLYKSTATASRYQQITGQHIWYTAPSGTAGNAITFTQAMTLDASGNLALGTTSASGMRLSVFGYSPELYDPTTYSAKFPYLPKGSQELFETGTGATAKAGYANLINISINDNQGSDQVYFGAVAQSNQNAGANFVFGRRTSAQTWAESARIDSSGNLLVGDTSSIAGRAQFSNLNNVGNEQVIRSRLGSNNNNAASYHLVSSTGGTDKLYIYGNGNVVNSNNSYGALSDIKIKENITDASAKLNGLMQVRVVNYNLKSDPDHKQIGVIAQEIEQIFPSMVDESPDRDAKGNDLGTTTKSVKYSVFVPMLIKALQEQQALITQLKARLDAANL